MAGPKSHIAACPGRTAGCTNNVHAHPGPVASEAGQEYVSIGEHTEDLVTVLLQLQHLASSCIQ